VTGNIISRFYIMAPRKAPKTTGESSGQSSDILSDTSPRNIDIVKTWTHVFNTLQYELVNCPDDSSDNEKEDLYIKYKVVSQSEMHKVATRPRLFPYYDMIGWALDHVDVPTRTIFNSQKVVVGTFRLGASTGDVQTVSHTKLYLQCRILRGFQKERM
jgi:hypothetical protein